MSLFVECRRMGGRNPSIGGILPIRDSDSGVWTETLPTAGVNSNQRVPTTGYGAFDESYVFVLHPAVDMYVDIAPTPNALNAARVIRIKAVSDNTEPTIVTASPNSRIQWRAADATLDTSATEPFRFAASRCHQLIQQYDVAGVVASGEEAIITRFIYASPDYPLKVFRVYYQNFFVDEVGTYHTANVAGFANSREVNGSSNIVIEGARFEAVANTTFKPILFNGGSATVTLLPGQGIWSDDIVLDAPLPARSTYYVRQVVSAPIGGGRPGGYRPVVIPANSDRAELNATVATLTAKLEVAATSITAMGTGTYHYGPTCIVARTPLDKKAVLLVGDSIIYGEDDQNNSSLSPYYSRGYAMRALDDDTHIMPRVAYGNFAVPGSRAGFTNDPENSAINATINPTNTVLENLATWGMRARILTSLPNLPFTAVLSNMANSNVANGLAWPGASYTSVTINTMAAWAKYFKELGNWNIPFAQVTLMPRTSPVSDSFTFNEATQTVVAENGKDGGVRFDVNGYLFTKPKDARGRELFDYIVDIRDVVFSGLDRDKWKPRPYDGAVAVDYAGGGSGTTIVLTPGNGGVITAGESIVLAVNTGGSVTFSNRGFIARSVSGGGGGNWSIVINGGAVAATLTGVRATAVPTDGDGTHPSGAVHRAIASRIIKMKDDGFFGNIT
jgi:hypothetical protein